MSTTTNRQALIEGLNHDLAGEYQAILMYTHYSAKLTGPYRRELRALFQTEIGDEQGHAQFLADKIAAFGGEPTTEPRPVPHADQPREMLSSSRRTVISFLKNEDGPALVEYAVILGVIIVIGITAIISLGNSTNATPPEEQCTRKQVRQAGRHSPRFSWSGSSTTLSKIRNNRGREE